MESLKALAARSVSARVTSEESLLKLEVPRTVIGDLLVAHENSWKRKEFLQPNKKENQTNRKQGGGMTMAGLSGKGHGKIFYSPTSGGSTQKRVGIHHR